MKIRTDYVTNSSSSSFVIGKKDDATITIESVFQTLKNLYKEYRQKTSELEKYIENNPQIGIIRKELRGGYYFTFSNNKNYAENRKITNDLKNKFGIDFYDTVVADYDWLQCKTYAEYEKYWLKRLKQDRHNHAPFSITDFFEEKEVYMVHYSKEKEVNYVNSKSEILGWYYSFADMMFENISCDKCDNITWCDEIERQECEESRRDIKENDIPEDKACLYLLGRVCIHSECGYIPDYIVDKLMDISEHSCNHMG